MHRSNPYEAPRADCAASAGPTGEAFTLAGSLTVSDALAADRLATRGIWSRLVFGLKIIGVGSLALVIVPLAITPFSSPAVKLMLLGVCIFVAAVLSAPLVWGRMRLNDAARNQFGMFAPKEYVFSPEKISSRSEDANSEFAWSRFGGFRANDSVALLFYGNSAFHLIVARSTLRDRAAWPALMALMESKLPRA